MTSQYMHIDLSSRHNSVNIAGVHQRRKMLIMDEKLTKWMPLYEISGKNMRMLLGSTVVYGTNSSLDKLQLMYSYV